MLVKLDFEGDGGDGGEGFGGELKDLSDLGGLLGDRNLGDLRDLVSFEEIVDVVFDASVEEIAPRGVITEFFCEVFECADGSYSCASKTVFVIGGHGFPDLLEDVAALDGL